MSADRVPAELEQYWQATAQYRDAEQRVTAAADARALAVVNMLEHGWTGGALALELGMSRNNVHKLARRGRIVRDGTMSA